ncbi:unnamed protein product [Pleuronectes platessa]|uniref:Uncharacterized protein n=1 Tax=Pleuronectes platessa TaxID=8262 RepID=A0A9N7UP20_PLEPL|nr:unnamed protein product [Pleuronectes platessa]
MPRAFPLLSSSSSCALLPRFPPPLLAPPSLGACMRPRLLWFPCVSGVFHSFRRWPVGLGSPFPSLTLPSPPPLARGPWACHPWFAWAFRWPSGVRLGFSPARLLPVRRASCPGAPDCAPRVASLSRPLRRRRPRARFPPSGFCPPLLYLLSHPSRHPPPFLPSSPLIPFSPCPALAAWPPPPPPCRRPSPLPPLVFSPLPLTLPAAGLCPRSSSCLPPVRPAPVFSGPPCPLSRGGAPGPAAACGACFRPTFRS